MDETLDDWSKIERYFDELDRRPIDTPAQLERWLEDVSELMACVNEVGTDRYVKMTCQTDDPERKAAFLDFVENIEPPCKQRGYALDVKYARSAAAALLPSGRYHVLDRATRASVEIFREENVALQTEESRLVQTFQEISGAQTVTFDGKERTLQQMAPYLERTDRAQRQAAWEAETARRMKDAAALEDVFDTLVALRHRMAVNADCADYQAYAFKSKQRFDYTPDHCSAFHEAVERFAVPVHRAMQRRRAAALRVEPLRPWDLAVDVQGRAPLTPFAATEEFCDKSSRVFHRVDPDLGAQFDEMRSEGFLDLESRKGKAPGGYQATYDDARHPFIFMNAVGVQRDVRTMIHEGGHAFHCYAARRDPILHYRSSPIEFAEVASMGMELLALKAYDEFYHGEELRRAVRAQLEGIVALLPWVATIDSFQRFLYTRPEHTRAERRAEWLELHQRFGGIADWSGHDEALAHSWQRQLHLFQSPFYYIEYGIAQLGALQVWRRSKTDPEGAVRAYRAALALGGSKPLPALFEAAGATFDFSERTIEPLMHFLQRELDSLPD